jgi:hypothetical protein
LAQQNRATVAVHVPDFQKLEFAMTKPTSQSHADVLERTISENEAASKKDLDRRLAAYALAAAAAGVGLAAASPANAEVVYTPVNITVTRGTLSIDLNADGLNDFILVDNFYTAPRSKFPLLGGRRLVVGGDASASVIPLNHEAKVLSSGATIGPSQTFRNVHDPRLLMAGAESVYRGSTGTCCVYLYGNWENVKNHYLGLKFQINGETHYGWARVTVKSFQDPNNHTGRINATLSGYAYETNPDLAITAGDIGGTHAANSSEVEPRDKTLGTLALGAIGRH